MRHHRAVADASTNPDPPDDGPSHRRRRTRNGDLVPADLPRPAPSHTVLAGRTVTLEPLDAERHGPELFPLLHGDADRERVWDWLPYGPFGSPEAYTGKLRLDAVSTDPLWFAIRVNARDRVEGVATYLEIRPEHGVIEIGHICLSTVLQQSVEATEALCLLMRHAMTDLGYRRLEWKCNAGNIGSRRAAGRLGFSYEGTFYRHMVTKGRNRDTAWFSILDEEWPLIDANISAWLDPANFAGDGRQRTSLGALNRALP